MKRIHVLEQNFDRTLPEDFSLAHSDCNTEYVFFKLRFLPEMAYRLFDEFHEDEVKRCSDDSYLVTVRYPLNEWTYHRLLSFGPYVEILEPSKAREEVKKRALKIAQQYNKEEN